jgi:DNA invertase Pin-like site-specific DNA recombinase
MAIIGYARVSTEEQSLALQLDALQAAGADRVFEDHGVSGSKTSRPGLDAALAYVRDGDTFLVWRLDRATRSTSHALSLVQELSDRGVAFRSITESLDTSGAMGRLMLTMIAAFAALERDVTIERTRAGLAAARRAGRVGGRPRALNDTMAAAVRAMRANGKPVTEIAREVGCSPATVYRVLSEAMPMVS